MAQTLRRLSLAALALMLFKVEAKDSLIMKSIRTIDAKFAQDAAAAFRYTNLEKVSQMAERRQALCAQQSEDCGKHTTWIKFGCTELTKPNEEILEAWMTPILSNLNSEALGDLSVSIFSLGNPRGVCAQIWWDLLHKKGKKSGNPDLPKQVLAKIVKKSGKDKVLRETLIALIFQQNMDLNARMENVRILFTQALNDPTSSPEILAQASSRLFYRYMDVAKVFLALTKNAGWQKQAPPESLMKILEDYCVAARFLMKPEACIKTIDAVSFPKKEDFRKRMEAANALDLGRGKGDLLSILGVSAKDCDAGSGEHNPHFFYFLAQYFRMRKDLVKSNQCIRRFTESFAESEFIAYLGNAETARNLLLKEGVAKTLAFHYKVEKEALKVVGRNSFLHTMLLLDKLKLLALMKKTDEFAAVKKVIIENFDSRPLQYIVYQIQEIESRLLNNGPGIVLDSKMESLRKSQTFMEIEWLQNKFLKGNRKEK